MCDVMENGLASFTVLRVDHTARVGKAMALVRCTHVSQL